MSKVENGAKAAAPRSKYAAKRQARLEQAIAEEKANVQEETEEVTDNSSKKVVPIDAAKFPEHIRNIGICLRYNADLRRFVAKAIINYLTQKGEINGNSKFVKFHKFWYSSLFHTLKNLSSKINFNTSLFCSLKFIIFILYSK